MPGDFTEGELLAIVQKLEDELREERQHRAIAAQTLQAQQQVKAAETGVRPGRTSEQLAADRDVTLAQRKEAFGALLDKRWDEARDKTRHPLTGGLLD